MSIFGEEKPARQDSPPHVLDVLEAFLAEYAGHRPLPAPMPSVPRQAATWWINQQRPANERIESPVRKGNGWRCPYHDRLLYTLRKFLSLKPDERRIILAAREDDVFWGGDDMDFFMDIIREHAEMRRVGVKAYRAACLQGMNNLASKAA